MNETVVILIAMLAVYGFYAALHEMRCLLWKIARRQDEKIDKTCGMEYNKKKD